MHARVRIVAALVLLTGLAAALAGGCAAVRPTGRLTIGVLALPSAADPASADNPGLLTLAYETLVARGPDGNFYPGLAKDWTVAPDGRALTLHLRTGVKFSDGADVTARDAAASLRRLQELDPAALGPLESIEVVGEQTLTIRMARPYPPIWGGLAAPRAAIVKLGPDGRPLGSGPFVIEELTADSLRLTVNPGYRWAPGYYRVRGPARVAEIVVRRFADAGALAAAMDAGAVDVVGTAGAAPLTAKQGWTTVAAPGQSLVYIGFNVRRPPFDDARVRRAIALLAAPGRAAAARAQPGWVPTVAYLPGAAWGAAEAAPSGDAAALLAEAGYRRGADGFYRSGGRALELIITTTERAADQAVAAAVADALRKAGIAASVRARGDYPAVVVFGDCDAYLGRFTWGEPDILYYLLHTGVETNRSGFADARVDRLLEAAAGAVNLSDRRSVYEALQVRLAEACPWIPLLNDREEWLVRPGVRNVRVGVGGCLYLTTADVR